jgi:biopolymer transport protein ExbD
VSTLSMKSPSPRSTVPALTLTTIIIAIVCTAAVPNSLYGSVSQQSKIPEGAVVINLDRNGSLRIDQEQVEFSGLIDRIHKASTTPNETTVFIVAAADVAFKELVRTVETVREAGVERVGILKAEGGSIRESLPPLGATVLSVDHSGVVRLDGKKTKLSDVASQLQRLFRRRTDRTVYVQANGALSFDAVGNVIDAAKAAGASRIALVASRE